MLRKFPEASGAFRKALLIQPNLAIGYLGLGMTEAWQNRLAAAMSDYRQVTRLAPKADIGWIALSGCAEKLGNKRKALSMRDTQRRLHPLPSRPACEVLPGAAADREVPFCRRICAMLESADTQPFDL